MTDSIINHLRVDMGMAAEDIQPRPFWSARDALTDPIMPAKPEFTWCSFTHTILKNCRNGDTIPRHSFVSTKPINATRSLVALGPTQGKHQLQTTAACVALFWLLIL